MHTRTRFATRRVKIIVARKTIVAMMRFSANMFFSCFTGPMRKAVEHRETMLPRVYRMAKVTGFVIANNACGGAAQHAWRGVLVRCDAGEKKRCGLAPRGPLPLTPFRNPPGS